MKNIYLHSFCTISAITTIFILFSCGDQLGQVGLPCVGGTDGDLVCTTSYSSVPTWEKQCFDHGDCPDNVPCIIPPYGSGGYGICDIGNRWASYGSGSYYSNGYYINDGYYYYQNYYPGGYYYYNDPYYSYPCYSNYDCGGYLSCYQGYCYSGCTSDIDCFNYYGYGSLCYAGVCNDYYFYRR